MLDTASQFLTGYLYAMGIGLLIVAVFLVAERLFPAERGQPWRDLWFNVRYALSAQLIGLALTPLVIALVVSPLREAWPGLFGWVKTAGVGSLALYAFLYYLLFDLLYYGFHRLQHTWPLLWREHLLHHSEVSLNATTTFRQHWLEEPLKVFFVVLPVAVVFESHPKVSGVALVVLQSWATFIHANLRLPLGPFGFVIAGPHFHRVHHSRLPQHLDRNFAVFFPFIDWIFGSYVHARAGEYPPTGLHSGGRIDDVMSAHLAPFRTPPRGRTE